MSDCPRIWEVEAARDGRLSGAALETHERHLEQCDACRTERARIAALGRQLLDLPGPELDDVAQRRLRQQILERVDASLTGRAGALASLSSSRALRIVGAVAAAALVLVLAGDWQWSRSSEGARAPKLVASSTAHDSTPPVVRAVTVNVADEGGARWSRRMSADDVEHIEVSEGRVRVDVLHVVPGTATRVSIIVPDGKIEDVGTTFHVTVEGAHTRHVTVDEGKVVLRLRGRDPVTIEAGGSWSLAPAPPSSAHTPHVASVATSSDVLVAAEDAAYMEVLRLLRAQRSDEARTAARDYLRRFPNGFRREEMGVVARGGHH